MTKLTCEAADLARREPNKRTCSPPQDGRHILRSRRPCKKRDSPCKAAAPARRAQHAKSHPLQEERPNMTARHDGRGELAPASHPGEALGQGARQGLEHRRCRMLSALTRPPSFASVWHHPPRSSRPCVSMIALKFLQGLPALGVRLRHPGSSGCCSAHAHFNPQGRP